MACKVCHAACGGGGGKEAGVANENENSQEAHEWNEGG